MADLLEKSCPLDTSPSPARSSPLDAVRIPIVIGVSGHRRIPMQDEAKLYDGVVKILTKIRRRYGGDTPLVLLSPLAEGADR